MVRLFQLCCREATCVELGVVHQSPYQLTTFKLTFESVLCNVDALLPKRSFGHVF